jgi:hypothetical protein
MDHIGTFIRRNTNKSTIYKIKAKPTYKLCELREVGIEKIKKVSQPYSVTMARNDFNVHEMRLMIRIVEGLQGDMAYGKQRIAVQKMLLGDRVVQIPMKMLMRENNQDYRCARNALNNLRTKEI